MSRRTKKRVNKRDEHFVKDRKRHLTSALSHLRLARVELHAVGADTYELDDLIEETDNAVRFYDRLTIRWW